MSDNNTSNYGFILLAAGLGTRFGGNKLTATLPHTQKAVIETTLEQLPQGFPIHVVCRPSQQTLIESIKQLEQRIESPIGISGSEQLQDGMGFSIAEAIQATSHWQGWVICLADMPWVQTDTYLSIIQALTSRSIVVPHIQSSSALKRGNPVGFTKAYQQNLMTLSGDSGARAIVQNNMTDVYKLLVKDPGILLDIDYPDDINKLLD